jgi:hypothetical protein
VAGDAPVQRQHVDDVVLEVRGGVEARRDVALVLGAVGNGRVRAGHGREPLQNGPEQLEAGRHVLVGVALFDEGADNRHVHAGRRHGQAVPDAAHEHVVRAPHLRPGDDDLDRLGVVRAGDGLDSWTLVWNWRMG